MVFTATAVTTTITDFVVETTGHVTVCLAGLESSVTQVEIYF